MFAALLIFLPIGGAELQLVPAFWMVMMGILFDRPMAQRRSAGVGGGRSAAVAVGARTARAARSGQRQGRGGARRGDGDGVHRRGLGAGAGAQAPRRDTLAAA